MKNRHSPTEQPNEPGMEAGGWTNGCWMTGGKGPYRTVEESQGPQGAG